MATAHGTDKSLVNRTEARHDAASRDLATCVSGGQRTGEMPFILTDGRSKPRPHQRKLIRKYVMLGKNLGKTRGPMAVTTTTSFDSRQTNGDLDGASSLLIKMGYSKIPGRVGSDLSFTHFAANVEPALVHEVLKCRFDTSNPRWILIRRISLILINPVSFIAKKVMYPLESHIIFHRKSKVDTSWFEFLISDPAYMHAAAFAIQTYLSYKSTVKSLVATERNDASFCSNAIAP